MRIIIILFFLSSKLFASDSLVIYTLPHQIRIEHNWKYVVSKNISLKSQEITNSSFKNIFTDNIPYKIINDTSYFSPINIEIEKLISAFENNFKIHKITPSDSLLNWLDTFQSPKIAFISVKGFTKKYDKDAVSYIIDATLGGIFLMQKKEASLLIQILIFDKKLKKFIYFESAGEYGEPLKNKFAEKVLRKSFEDFIKKGSNIKAK